MDGVSFVEYLLLRELAYHRTNVRRSLREDTRPVAQVRIRIGLNRFVPRGVKVIEDDIGVRDNSVGLLFRV